MKRLICLILAVGLLTALTACNNVNKPEPVETTVSEPSVEPPTAYTEPSAEPTDAPEPTQEQKPFELTEQSCRLYRDELGVTWVQAWVTVKNLSETPLVLPYASLTLSGDGEELGVLQDVAAFPPVIAPGEQGCYYEETRLDTAFDGAPEVSLDAEIAQAELDEPLRYAVSESKLADSRYGGLTLTGKVRNDSGADEPLACVAAVLRDKDGKLVAVLYTYLTETLKAGETKEFELSDFMLPEDIRAEQVDSIEVYAYHPQ